MRAAVISFTRNGKDLCRKIVAGLKLCGWECRGYIQERYVDDNLTFEGLSAVGAGTSEWTKRQFAESDAIVFVGAVGIAVRAVAPFLRDKMTDPAVVAVDEQGRFSVSLLSGHVGGANALAKTVARITGAMPVVTTATDLNGVFAVDEFAARHRLKMSDRTLAKEISAALLDGEDVGFFSDFPVKGRIPSGLAHNEARRRNIWITIRDGRKPGGLPWPMMGKGGGVLRLAPSIVTLGIGCRRGTEAEQIEVFVKRAFGRACIDISSVEKIASISLKGEEAGLCEFAEKLGAEFEVYSAEELALCPGVFSDSAFVERTTGVGNVCERAAMTSIHKNGGEGLMIMDKQAGGGVTAAAAARRCTVSMEGWR